MIEVVILLWVSVAISTVVIMTLRKKPKPNRWDDIVYLDWSDRPSNIINITKFGDRCLVEYRGKYGNDSAFRYLRNHNLYFRDTGKCAREEVRRRLNGI